MNAMRVGNGRQHALDLLGVAINGPNPLAPFSECLGSGDDICSPTLQEFYARAAVDGPAFTSMFQGATHWRAYVALSVSGSLFGNLGLAIASVAMIAMRPVVNVFSVAVLAHYASPEKRSAAFDRH